MMTRTLTAAASRRRAGAIACAIIAVATTACASPHHGVGTIGGGASCAERPDSAFLASARTAFIGVMLAGATVSTGEGSTLTSPARVRVTQYLKGDGPQVVTVATGVTQASGGSVIGSAEGITPQAGQRWRIYSISRRMPYQTSVCSGSAMVP
jgi:hypothetical protein